MLSSSLVGCIGYVFLGVFAVLGIRALVFLLTRRCCRRGLWVFPRLLEDNTFLGPFSPLYDWDDKPNEGVAVRLRRFKNLLLADLGVQRPRPRRKKRKN